MSLDPSRQRKLIAAARLLESDKGGERQAALEAVLRLLPEGMTLAALLEQALTVPPRPDWRKQWDKPSAPAWQVLARQVLAHRQHLTAKELAFAANMAGARFEPSQGQRDWLNDIAERLMGVEA